MSLLSSPSMVIFPIEPLFPSLLGIHKFFQVRSNGITLPVSCGLAPPLRIISAKQKGMGNYREVLLCEESCISLERERQCSCSEWLPSLEMLMEGIEFH